MLDDSMNSFASITIVGSDDFSLRVRMRKRRVRRKQTGGLCHRFLACFMHAAYVCIGWLASTPDVTLRDLGAETSYAMRSVYEACTMLTNTTNGRPRKGIFAFATIWVVWTESKHVCLRQCLVTNVVFIIDVCKPGAPRRMCLILLHNIFALAD